MLKKLQKWEFFDIVSMFTFTSYNAFSNRMASI